MTPQEGRWARQPHGRLFPVRQNGASWSRAQPLEGGSRSPVSFAAETSPAPSGGWGQQPRSLWGPGAVAVGSDCDAGFGERWRLDRRSPRLPRSGCGCGSRARDTGRPACCSAPFFTSLVCAGKESRRGGPRVRGCGTRGLGPPRAGTCRGGGRGVRPAAAVSADTCCRSPWFPEPS